MNIQPGCAALLLLSMIQACGSDGDEANFAHYLGEMDESIDAAEASLAIHHDAALSSTDSGMMRALERTHMEPMSTAMDAMGRAQRGMALCGGHMGLAGGQDEIDPFMRHNDDMGDAIDRAWDELTRHWRAMDEAPTLERGMDEEHAHRSAMRDITAQMREHRDAISTEMDALGDGRLDDVSGVCAHARPLTWHAPCCA